MQAGIKRDIISAPSLSRLFQLPLPVGLPFIGRLFVNAGARRSLRLGLVVFDLANGVQQFLQDDQGLFGMCGSQQGGVAREAHEGVLELRPDSTLRGFDRLGGHGKGGERARDHTPDQDGEEFLPDAVGGVAMKLLDMLEGFLVSVVGFDCPATPVQGDNRGAGKAAGVDQVGQQHRDGTIGSFQANGADAHRGKGATLGGGERALERIRGGEPEAGFGPPTARKGLDGRKGGGRGTTHEIEARVLMEVMKEAVAGETAVKETQAVRGQPGEQLLRLFTLITVLECTDGASDRQAAEDIVGRRDQALRVMASAGILQAALGIESLPDGLGRRQAVFGPIEGEDRQAVPQILLSRRKHLVRQGDGLVEQCFKGFPGNLGACLAQGASMWALPLWPQATPTGHGEELTEFRIDAFVPATGDQRQEYHDQPYQRELAAAGEVLGTLLGNRLNEVEEKGEQSLIKIDRCRRFFLSLCFSWFNCQCMNTLRQYALIRLCLKSTALTGGAGQPAFLP